MWGCRIKVFAREPDARGWLEAILEGPAVRGLGADGSGRARPAPW
jgi:hypothetical protein